jgi:hypothetical protein
LDEMRSGHVRIAAGYDEQIACGLSCLASPRLADDEEEQSTLTMVSDCHRLVSKRWEQ